MDLEKKVNQRANSKCELCTSDVELSVYDVKPNSAASVDTSVLLCAKCRQQIESPELMDPVHWYCLSESMWSEVPAVQVLAYRVLKSMGGDANALNLLEQLYLDEENQKWADAGVVDSGDVVTTIDSNGTVLASGDTVTLIKDLVVKGANFTAKRGTSVKNISLTDDAKFVEGRVNGTRIVLVAAYLKKS